MIVATSWTKQILDQTTTVTLSIPRVKNSKHLEIDGKP